MNLIRQARMARWSWAVAGLLGIVVWSEPAAGQPASRTGRLDYSAFQIIAERNIFNPNRGRRAPAVEEDSRPPSRVDAFTLVGTMIYRKGPFAFFDGTRPDYRKVLQPGGTIADYKVADIGVGQVTLENGPNHLKLKVGMQLRRADDGPWQVTEATDTYASVRSWGGERREEDRRGESRGFDRNFDFRRGESRGFDSRRGESRGFDSRRGESRSVTTAASTSPPAAPSSGPALTPEQENEILQRLMRRREEESK